MRTGGRLSTRGDRFFAAMTGNAAQMHLGGEAAGSLAAARKNNRSKLRKNKRNKTHNLNQKNR